MIDININVIIAVLFILSFIYVCRRLTKTKMRTALIAAVLVALGLLGPTDAVCYLKNEKTALCHKVGDIEFIDSYNLTNLKTSVYHETLGSNSLKGLSANLKSLDLSEGNIQLIEPGTFRKLTGLRDLKLSDNSIDQLDGSALEGLEELKNLDLRRNNIRQLPSALTELTALKNLEVSGNPLVCDCATLRVRDDLLATGVKISKKVSCSSPRNLKGVSILVPEAEVICMFEEQDSEMQGDEADSGSGDFEDDVEVPAEVSTVSAPHEDHHAAVTPEIITDDLIIPVQGRSRLLDSESPTESSTGSTSVSDSSESSVSTAEGDSPTHSDDFEFTPVAQDAVDDLIVRGTDGEDDPDEEGSGFEGSGTDSWQPLDPKDFVTTPAKVEEITTTTTEQPTPSTQSWYDVLFGSVLSTTETDDAVPEVIPEETTPETTTTTTTARPSIDRGIIIPNINPVTEETVVTKKANDLDATIPSVTQSGENGKIVSETSSNTTETAVGAASTAGGQKSMGSYIVLAALLGVLAALVVFAAYRSGFCKKKPSADVERGTELKDVKKSLLDPTNTPQPRIASNGNMENVPLVAPANEAWASPQESRQWPAQTNGTKNPSNAESDPVKPPRKSLPPQEDTNGLQEVKTHSPMSTFAPRTNDSQGNSVTPPNSPSEGGYDGKLSPPLSPNAQRVKITLQDNPDSIPKTPILITRTKPGVNLVKTP